MLFMMIYDSHVIYECNWVAPLPSLPKVGFGTTPATVSDQEIDALKTMLSEQEDKELHWLNKHLALERLLFKTSVQGWVLYSTYKGV